MHPQTNPWLLYEPMDEPSFRPIFEELLHRGFLHVFEQGDEMLGMCKLMPMKHRNSHIIYLGGVAIDPDHAGKGLGRQMVTEAIALARQSGYTRIELTVATVNPRAIGLYESLGFANEGLLKNYTYLASESRYIDEYVMGLLL